MQNIKTTLIYNMTCGHNFMGGNNNMAKINTTNLKYVPNSNNDNICNSSKVANY